MCSTSGLDWDCFWDISSLPFSKVTAPNAPYCPFITGLNIEEEEEETAGGATKQRSNKLTEEEESPSTTADDDEEEEKALSTITPLLLRASFVAAIGGK